MQLQLRQIWRGKAKTASNVVTPAKADDCDDVYFDEELNLTQSEGETYEEKTNDDSNSNRDNDSEEEDADESDDDGYGGYDGGYYYSDGRYERKRSQMMSPIISPVTA